jgi:hypothetical protein
MFDWEDQAADNEETSHLLRAYTTSTRTLKQYNTHEQPAFHENSKSFWERHCNCCLGANDRHELTRQEIYYFYKFADDQIAPYNELNSDHEQTLKQLYQLAFHKEPPADLKDECWTDIGFQGKNPRTDFRGGGYLSL